MGLEDLGLDLFNPWWTRPDLHRQFPLSKRIGLLLPSRAQTQETNKTPQTLYFKGSFVLTTEMREFFPIRLLPFHHTFLFLSIAICGYFHSLKNIFCVARETSAVFFEVGKIARLAEDAAIGIARTGGNKNVRLA